MSAAGDNGKLLNDEEVAVVCEQFNDVEIQDAGHPHHDQATETDSPLFLATPVNGMPQAEASPTKARHRRKKKLEIPENWTDVPKIGAILHDTRFVAMRVPLADQYTPLLVHQELEQELWTPQAFLQYETQDPLLDIGLVIDLTNTFKYYDGEAAFANTKVRYVKLRIEGFKAPPTEEDAQKFMTIVDDFFASNESRQVAVHCTHGLNRTGYLIVQYLVRRMHWRVSKALQCFNAARPPGLIKYMYIDDLYKKLGQEDEIAEYPTLPQWANKYSKRKTFE